MRKLTNKSSLSLGRTSAGNVCWFLGVLYRGSRGIREIRHDPEISCGTGGLGKFI